jgi:hypothetical protein
MNTNFNRWFELIPSRKSGIGDALKSAYILVCLMTFPPLAYKGTTSSNDRIKWTEQLSWKFTFNLHQLTNICFEKVSWRGNRFFRLYVVFKAEDGGSIFLRNVGIGLHAHTALQPTRTISISSEP